MKNISKFFLISVIISCLSGCDTLERSLNGLKHFAGNSIRKLKKSSEKEQRAPEGGYLSKGIVTIKSEVRKKNSSNKKEEDGSAFGSLKIEEMKNATKWDLIQLVSDLESQLKEANKKYNSASDELRLLRLEYQKQVFNLSNSLDKERQKNLELKDLIVKSEFDVLKAKQKLMEVKTNLVAKNNAFQASYPVFYEVVKGDSLWKIASKKSIYNNSYKWTEIYYANIDKIKEANISNEQNETSDWVYPGMTLVIPRYFEVLLSEFDKKSLKDIPSNKIVNSEEIEATEGDNDKPSEEEESY